MRTTITIDDELLAEAKARAARTGRTLTAVVEDALRAAFARNVRPAAEPPPEVPVSSGGRLLPAVDLDDSAGLVDLLEGAHR